MHLGAWSVEISYDCGHSGFVTHSSCEVDWLLWVVLREALDLPYTQSVLLGISRATAVTYLGAGQLVFGAETPMSHDEALQTFGAT